MVVGIQSLTLKCLAKVFSLKSFLEKLIVTISWVMRVYIVLVKVCEKAHLNHLGRVFRGSLATWPKSRMTREIQPSKETLQIPACASHMAFRGLALMSQS